MSRAGVDALAPSAPGAFVPDLDAASRRAWLLSNGSYATVVSATGTGASWYGDHALAGSCSMGLEDQGGCAFYVREPAAGRLWSIGHEPVRRTPRRYDVEWRPGVVELSRLDDEIESRMEVCVAPEAALEVRRLTLANRSCEPRTLELTSALDVVLAPPANHAGHPVFSKLFVETLFDRESGGLLARRRPRSHQERHPWMFCALLGPGPLEHETDRARFLGRGAERSRPLALRRDTPLEGRTGDVLDPMFVLRRTVTLAPGEVAEWTFVLGAAAERAEALSTLARCAAPGFAEAMFAGAEAAAAPARRGCDAAFERALQSLVSALYVGGPEWRAAPEVLARLRMDRQGLAELGIPLDEPLIVVDAREVAVAGCVPTLIRLHHDLIARRVSCRLLIAHDDRAKPIESDDRVILVRAGAVPRADLDAIFALACVVIADEPALERLGLSGTEEVDGDSPRAALHLRPAPSQTAPAPAVDGAVAPAPRNGDRAPEEKLADWNGTGGFAAGGTEYVIRLARGPDGALRLPPQPWVNVIANERLGFLASETGAGFTWSGNSREHRLTPWSNDPLADPHGEALFVRDETGAFWSPLAGPAPRGQGAYEMRHGFGYSIGRHRSADLLEEVLLFVPPGDPVKVARVAITNLEARSRKLSLFAFQRLVLGATPERDSRFVVTRHDARSGALLARNPMAGDFAGHVAFTSVIAAVPERATSFTADREAFIGRHGTISSPAALRDPGPLDGCAGAGLDPCFAQQIEIEIAPGERFECAFLLGEAASEQEALELVARYDSLAALERAFEEAREAWRTLLGAVKIETPSPRLDRMVNGWLLYQALSCRILGRSATYQSGGAFGFRDQLQDASAFNTVAPERYRAQILLHAAHQFMEGDVQHWWHPPAGRGLRTRFADDRLWLPWAAADYVRATGDWSVLDDVVPYLDAPPLPQGEDEVYQLPVVTETSGDVYDHCCRAIDASMALGSHGLPLFGSGDWNDGMSRVGVEGRGESVWMGFFLYDVLGAFAPLAERRGDTGRARRYDAHREALRIAVNDAGWDGEWYRRGFYDDGTPLGSARGDECRIDAVAQAWSVISGAAPPERARSAMAALERHLVSEPAGLIRLLTPAFRDTPHDPGYIKGYAPGVRENGGQYTHAALWAVRAAAELGLNDRAAHWLELLNPSAHSGTPEEVAVYQVEPYVIAADVYSEPPLVGRGGWTWYTGSAGWMQRVALESVLGIRVEGGAALVVRPCVPDSWPRFSVALRLPGGNTRYEVEVVNPDSHARAVQGATVDGKAVPIAEGAARVPLVRDEAVHRVKIVLG